ncbi:MAG: homoserine dehydrogenase [Tissierellia bacterium]|nr:homoserine dehydrogenase [Tissierellia bacterium]
MEKVKIGLLGMGTVGSGVWKILKTNRDEIIRNCGYEIEVSKILVKDLGKQRDVDAPDELYTDDFEDILSDDGIDIVVEVMGGIEPAREYILKSMDAGKHVVSANKALIADHGKEIFKKSKSKGVMFLYEASVAGGIPVLSSIRESLAGNRVEEVMGIVNGTTNYILTKMAKEGVDFESVLKEAQDKGYAELDPTADVEGYDAAHKLTILGILSFGTDIELSSVYREGITNIQPIDIEYAKELGYAIKLLAIGKDRGGDIEMRVHPTFIPLEHPLASVGDVFNAVFLKGNAVGDLMFYGRGAGDMPTGSAVVGDIIDIVKNRNNIYYISNSRDEKLVKPMEETVCKYYIRIMVKDKPGVLGKIASKFGKNNVSLSSVIQKGRKTPTVSLVFITHNSREGNIQEAMEDILSIEEVVEIANLIRVENGVDE